MYDAALHAEAFVCIAFVNYVASVITFQGAEDGHSGSSPEPSRTGSEVRFEPAQSAVLANRKKTL